LANLLKRRLFVTGFVSLVAIIWIALNCNAQEVGQVVGREIKTNAGSNTVAPDTNQDGPVEIVFRRALKPGATTSMPASSSELKTAPLVPSGYSLYHGLGYHIETKATVLNAYNVVVFKFPSANQQSVFDALRILHLEVDDLSPSGFSWFDRTLLPATSPEEESNSPAQGKYEQYLPDFDAKSKAVLVNKLGLFIVVSKDQPELQAAHPFTELELNINSPQQVQVGSQVTYTISIKNKGPKPAGDVAVLNNLDSDMRFLSATSSQGKCRPSQQSSTRITCALGSLPVDATATVNIRALVRSNFSLDKEIRRRSNQTFVVFKEHPEDITNKSNIIDKETTLTSIPRGLE